MEDIREKQVDEFLEYIGNLPVNGYYTSYGIVDANMTAEQFKLFAYDRDSSQLFEPRLYRKTLSALLTDFINKVRYNVDWSSVELNRDDFFEYIDWYRVNDDINSVDYDKIRSLMSDGDRFNNESLVSVYYILKMVQQSLYTNDQRNYMNLFAEATSSVDRQQLMDAISFYDANKSKKSLLDEFILTTLKKHPRTRQGMIVNEYVLSYLKHGYIGAVTNTNNLRTRISNDLSQQEALNVIEASDIYDKTKSEDENIANYVDVLIFSELIKCVERLGFSTEIFITYFNECMRTGDLTYITRFDRSGDLGTLLVNLNAEKVKRLYSSLGVSNTEEYIEKYCSSKEGPRKG